MKPALAVWIAAVALLFSAEAATADTAADEASFVSAINSVRVSHGRAPLQVHANLVDKTRAWSRTMRDSGHIFHSKLSEGIVVSWLKLGENVGMGGSVGGIHDAFVRSPRHFANLVDPEFTHVGVGVVNDRGTIFVSEMFMRVSAARVPGPRPAPPVPAPVPTTPAPLTAPRRTSRPPSRPGSPAPGAAPPEAPVPETPGGSPEPSALLLSVLERLRAFEP